MGSVMLARHDRADGPDETAIAALQHHPRFDAAMHMAARATVEGYRGHWILSGLVSDRGRFVAGMLILDLHFLSVGAGFTTAQLRQEALALGVCSPGRASALLGCLQLVGFVRTVTGDDRRTHPLAPTERFLDLHRERWARNFEALRLVDPAQGSAALAALAEEPFLGAFIHSFAAAYRKGFRMILRVPELGVTAERNGGIVALLALLTADADAEPISIAHLARRLSVSRAHLLTVLREAEQLGLARTVGPRGGYRAGPALRPIFRRFFAIMFLLQREAIEAAMPSVAGCGPDAPTGEVPVDDLAWVADGGTHGRSSQNLPLPGRIAQFIP